MDIYIIISYTTHKYNGKPKGLFGSMVDSLKYDFSCELWESWCELTIMKNLKYVWLKQLSTIYSTRAW